MGRCASIFLLLAVLFLVLSASAEDRPLFPPLASLDDAEDITSKVIAWDVPAGKCEEYSIFDEIPPLPEHGPVCKAP